VQIGEHHYGEARKRADREQARKQDRAQVSRQRAEIGCPGIDEARDGEPQAGQRADADDEDRPPSSSRVARARDLFGDIVIDAGEKHEGNPDDDADEGGAHELHVSAALIPARGTDGGESDHRYHGRCDREHFTGDVDNAASDLGHELPHELVSSSRTLPA
jgi:hypothetical protein